MGKYKELAADIVAHVGGKENVTGLRHCFTRLRFNLADDKKADTAYLKNRDGVISVVNSGGEYMVVIGEHVHDVYLDVPKDKKQFPEFVTLKERTTDRRYSLDEKEVVLTEKIAKELEVQAGDMIKIRDEEKGDL